MLLPGPGGGERLVERALGSPAQFGVRQRGIGPDGDDVARTARCDLVVELQVVDLFELAHQFQHRDAAARADVENLVGLLVLVAGHAVDRRHVGFGEVHDVDVVADARPVGRRVVVAEDREALAQSGGGLRDEGHEVLRHAARQFADQRRRMCADGVEIAQRDAFHAGVGGERVAQNVLAHLLGVAVGRSGRLAGRLLRHGLLLRLAVNGARRREDDVPAAEFTHQADDVHKRGEVVAVVFERLLHRLAHGFRRCEVDHRVEFVLFEDLAESRPVAAVDLDEGDVHAGDLAHAFDGVEVAVRKVVDDHHVVAGVDEFHGGVRADVACTAADQYTRFFHR